MMTRRSESKGSFLETSATPRLANPMVKKMRLAWLSLDGLQVFYKKYDVWQKKMILSVHRMVRKKKHDQKRNPLRSAAASFFAQGGVEFLSTQQMAGAQEAILGQSSAHSFATGPWKDEEWSDFVTFFDSKKWEDRSKWNWLKTSKVKVLASNVTCFILLLASSRHKRSRGQEMKPLPLKSYKYLHES